MGIDSDAVDDLGANCLAFCAAADDTWRMNVCVQMGANVNQVWKEDGLSYNIIKYVQDRIGEESMEGMFLMLLSVGADPRGAVLPQRVKAQVSLWLESLETAKQCFTAIFDNEALENELASFVFHEAFLRKALNSV